jgi:hypothetical protein
MGRYEKLQLASMKHSILSCSREKTSKKKRHRHQRRALERAGVQAIS